MWQFLKGKLNSSFQKLFDGSVLGVPILRNLQDAALEEKKIKGGEQMLFIGKEPKKGQVRMLLRCSEHGPVSITVTVASDSDFKKTYHCPEPNCGKKLEGLA